jgi:DNA-binding MarR family transcriptional regulator
MIQFNNSLIYKIHSFIYNVDSAFELVLNKNAKINYTEFLIMLALEEDINYTQDQIAYWSNFTKSTVSKTIDKLVSKKFLSRKEHKEDRRQKTISFTANGKKELEVAKILGDKQAQDLFECLNESEVKAIEGIMDKLNKVGVNYMLSKLK